MRLIDADELMEHVYRDKLDSRELIAKMIEQAPSVKEIPTKIPIEIFEKLVLQQENKQLIAELLKRPPMVVETAYLYATNYLLYGEDVTEKWVTATQNARALEKAYREGYHDALQRLAESENATSRQTVKEQMFKYGFHAPDMTVTEFIEDLPPVASQPKTGHWIDMDEGFSPCECSECGTVEFNKSKYCPNCGISMVEPKVEIKVESEEEK